jgi:hypothetical protein
MTSIKQENNVTNTETYVCLALTIIEGHCGIGSPMLLGCNGEPTQKYPQTMHLRKPSSEKRAR